MAGSPKSKKGKPGSEKRKNSPKPKGKKEKDEDTVQIEDLKAITLEDNAWQSVVVMVVVESQKLYDDFLQQLNNLPENFTVISPRNLLNTSEKETPGTKSRGSSTTRKRSASKNSKKTNKTKDVGVKKGGKKQEQNDEESDDNKNCTKTCVLLKKYILELKNSDIKENKNGEKKEQHETLNKHVINDMEGNKQSATNKENLISLIQRYIIIWGFYDPNLLQECSNFNILVKAIINIKDKRSFEKSAESTSVKEKKQKGKAQKTSDHRHEDHASEEYLIFVDKFYESTSEFLEMYKNVLFFNYTVKNTVNDVQFSFEKNILKILCGISEAWGKFSKYNERLQIQEVPIVHEILTLDDAYLYTTMVSMIPPECVTVPIIIHCMLKQICWWDEYILSKIDEPCENTDLHSIVSTSTNTMDSDVVDHSVILSTSTIDTKTSSGSEATMKNITPVLIDERDDIQRKTFHLHLPEIHFQKITMDMLMSSPVFKLWLNYPLTSQSRTKWYRFHLQRFKQCAENCYFDSDQLFILYLYQSLMNVLISKPDNLSIRKDEDNLLENDESETYLLATNKETTDNASLTSFVQGMICNILCRVSKNYKSYSSLTERSAYSAESTCKDIFEDINSKSSVLSKWYEVKTQVSSLYGRLLDEKHNYKLKKLNKLKSFLLCSEFVTLYEDINLYGRVEDNDFMKRYEFMENLNTTTMCQSLQNAYENFINVDYYYFPLLDAILLWFSNSAKKDLTLSRKKKGVLETPLGFRDFYKYKLGGKMNFEEMPGSEGVSSSSDNDNFSGSISSHQVSQVTHDSHTKVDEFPPTTVTNLGSLRIEHNESYEYFFSPDSTRVTVKKTKYFSDQINIAVSVQKNNTSLYYDLQPEVANPFIKVTMKMHNDITVRSQLTWSLPVSPQLHTVLDEVSNPDSQIADVSSSLSCELSMTLPSGLLVEVIPTTSGIGPFYIRQRYLLKGPTCGHVWEETHRCYLKNGTILIFNSDSTIYILYNNGTMVRCNAFEWEKTVLKDVPIKDESNAKENDLEDDKTKKTNKGISEKGKKDMKGKGKNKEKKDDKNQESISTGNKKKGKKLSYKIITEDINLDVEKTFEHELYECVITQHSVLSWDGSCTEFDHGINTNNSKIHDLRMAFDQINQELYLQRSDGMTILFTPAEFSVLFPDASKITTYTDDSKELNVASEHLAVTDAITEKPKSLNEMDIRRKETELDSATGSLEETSRSQSSDNQNEKEHPKSEEDFVYVESSYLIEHSNYARVKYINNNCDVEITLPGNIIVYLDQNRMFTIDSGGNEKITLSENNLVFEAQVMEESLQRSVTTLHFRNVNTSPSVSCQTVDSLCNVFSVSEKGHTCIVKSGADDWGHDSVPYTPLHPENIERCFVLNRDLTGYEMLQNCKKRSESNVETIKTPIIANNDELFTLYTQTPIFKNMSDQFLLSYVNEHNLPALLKRKDLLKLDEMPENIWFYPHLSKVSDKKSEENPLKSRGKIPQAVGTWKYSRIKNNINLSDWFSEALEKYMKMNESIIKKYQDHYRDETRNEETYAEGDLHKQQVLGSQSYFLTDNLPTVVLDRILNDKDQISIHSVSASASSKVTSLFDMLKQVKQK